MTPYTPVKRKPLTPLQRTKLFLEHGGKCCICKEKIGLNEKWIDEHINPLGMTGTNDWSNRGPAHVACAKTKTADDKANIAKAKRIQAKHLGAKGKSKIQSRGFGQFKSNSKNLDGEYVE